MNGTPSDQGQPLPRDGEQPPGSEPATGGTDLAHRAGLAINPITGEITDLTVAPNSELVQRLAIARELHGQIKDFEAAVSDELVSRMDAAASWTLRDGEYEATAPSPAAGLVHYPPDELEAALQTLLAEKTITPEAAEKACQRRLIIEVEPPFYLDIRKLAEDVGKSQIFLAGQPMKEMKAEWSVKASQRGIEALKKVPAAAKALEGASIAVTPPRRKASVKRRP